MEKPYFCGRARNIYYHGVTNTSYINYQLGQRAGSLRQKKCSLMAIFLVEVIEVVRGLSNQYNGILYGTAQLSHVLNEQYLAVLVELSHPTYPMFRLHQTPGTLSIRGN